MHRRTFLRNAALGLGAAALARSAAAEPVERTLGVAIVGLGSYATHQIAPALLHAQKCRLAGIVTGTPAKAEAWMKQYDLDRAHVYDYQTYDRIADDDAIDIVYVVTPNVLHPEHVIRAAEAGKHVITEKPMATNVADCEAMIAACRKAGVQLSVGYRNHYSPFHREMMRLGQEQVFGPVKVVEASFGFRIGDPTQWRMNKHMAGGGALLDVGVYCIQGARYVTGEEPVAVTAHAFTTDREKFRDVEETVLWTLEFPSGAVANSSTTYNGSVNRLYAMAPEGWFALDPAYHYTGTEGRTSRGPMAFEPVVQQAVQLDDFADSILAGRENRITGEEGLRDMRIVEAIYRSIEAGGERIALAG